MLTEAFENEVEYVQVQDILVQEQDGVLVANSALVPVLWNTLVPRVVSEVSRLALNSKEAFQHLLVKYALWMLGRLVGHEAVDERVCCLADGEAGERSVEEVGVVGDRSLKCDLTLLGHDGDVVVCCSSVGL